MEFESLKMMLFCRNIPCYVFWKDKKLSYQGGNEHFLQAIGAGSVNDVQGKTDYDFPWATDAKSYQDSDLKILEGKSVLNSKEIRWHVNGPHHVIVNKLPLKDEKDRIVGVLGIHQDVSIGLMDPSSTPANKAINDILPDHTSSLIEVSQSTNLVVESEVELFSTLKNASHASLTHRELECLSLWLSGYSIKESAYCLKISQKSIEAYRKHIKDKMGVYHKYQLIDMMQAKGVFHLFLALAKLIQQKSKNN